MSETMRRYLPWQLCFAFAGAFVSNLFLVTPWWTVRWWQHFGLSYAVAIVLLLLSWIIVLGGVRLVRKARAR